MLSSLASICEPLDLFPLCSCRVCVCVCVFLCTQGDAGEEDHFVHCTDPACATFELTSVGSGGVVMAMVVLLLEALSGQPQ